MSSASCLREDWGVNPRILPVSTVGIKAGGPTRLFLRRLRTRPRLPPMRKQLLPLLLLAPLLAAGGPVRVGEDITARFTMRSMGTTATLTLAGPDSSALAPLAARALRNFERVDSLMSNWTATSEVARLNRALADATPYDALAVQPETGRVLGAALHIAAASGGAFDPTVEPLVRLWGFLGGRPARPDSAAIDAVLPRVGHRALAWDAPRRVLQPARAGLQIDLGGIAKGYAVDCVRDSLMRMGVTDALIDLSGNIAQLGSPPGREHWRLGLRDPAKPDATLGTLTLTRSAVATSGDYEQFVAADGRRYGHILDPRTGWPVDSLASVTVVMDSAMEADAWATALCVMGPAAARRLAAARDDMDVILVERRENGPDLLWVESSFAGRFTMHSGETSGYRLHRF